MNWQRILAIVWCSGAMIRTILWCTGDIIRTGAWCTGSMILICAVVYWQHATDGYRGVLADATDSCVVYWQLIMTVAWCTGGMILAGAWYTGR